MTIPRPQPLRRALVGRLLSEMQRRGVTPEQLATRSGYNLRTVQRLLTGETCLVETLERCENALRADLLDCSCPQGDDVRPESLTIAHSLRPIQGWKEAAAILQVPVSTLRRHRRSLGDRRKKPWWPNEAALRFWYDGLVSGDHASERRSA